MTEVVRVLVVEDNPADVDLLREILPETGPPGFDIQSVSRLSEALARLKESGSDVVLLDLGLPDSQGLETFRVLSRTAPHLPIIVLTGNSDREMALAAVKEGAQDYILKGRIDGEALARSVRFAIERKRSEDALKESEERFRRLMNEAADAIFVHDESGRLMDVNRVACQNLGYSREELLSKNIGDIDPKAIRAGNNKLWDRVFAGESFTFESCQIRKDGSTLPVEVRLGSVILPSGPAIMGVIRDITDRKHAQSREQLSRDILSSLNHRGGATDAIRDILCLVKESTEIEAAGIRLRAGDDFPYFQTNGFPDHFVELERSLCARDEAGRLRRDSEGNVLLECMCGNIIRGRTDPKQPFFTPGGSFWSNGTTDLLASTTEEDRQARTRNRCNGEGYESVALIPLRSNGDIIGLLQLNDHRRNQFTLEMIQFFEGLGASIGIALARKRAEEGLRDSEEKYRALVENAGEAILIAQDGMLKYVNHKTIEMTGYSEQELRSLPFLEFVHQDDRAMVGENYMSRVKGDVSIPRYEFRVIRKDGSIKWVVIEAALMTWERKPATLNFLADITERIEAEKAWRQAEENFRRSQEDSPLGIRIVSAKGETLFANREILDLYGFDHVEELKTTPVKERYTPESYAEYQVRKKKRTRGEEYPSEYQIDIIRKNGEIRSLQVSRKAVLWDGKPQDQAIYRDITESKKAEVRIRETVASLRKALGGIIQVLSSVSETRDPYTAGHQKRVADLARAIAQELAFPPDRVEGMRVAGTIHDIGKIGIPAEILSKPTHLSEIEYSLIQAHAQIGHDILGNIELGWPIGQIILQHHERMDGSGYPQGLKGEDILFESRILAVADVIEAMASHRPYRPALGIDAAILEIEKGKGVLYELSVVEACLTLFREKGYTLKE
jgi:PAS domain S-box-containing protein